MTRNGQPVGPFGVMGGAFQTQGHVQVLIRLLIGRQNVQAAIDAPRWQILPGNRVGVETEMDGRICERLRQMGHHLEVLPSHTFGGAQMIWREPGHYIGASESRKDGQVVAY